jgi:hypothetical protein
MECDIYIFVLLSVTTIVLLLKNIYHDYIFNQYVLVLISSIKVIETIIIIIQNHSESFYYYHYDKYTIILTFILHNNSIVAILLKILVLLIHSTIIQ